MRTCDMTISVAEGDRVLFIMDGIVKSKCHLLSKPIIILGLILLDFNAQN